MSFRKYLIENPIVVKGHSSWPRTYCKQIIFTVEHVQIRDFLTWKTTRKNKLLAEERMAQSFSVEEKMAVQMLRLVFWKKSRWKQWGRVIYFYKHFIQNKSRRARICEKRSRNFKSPQSPKYCPIHWLWVSIKSDRYCHGICHWWHFIRLHSATKRRVHSRG